MKSVHDNNNSNHSMKFENMGFNEESIEINGFNTLTTKKTTTITTTTTSNNNTSNNKYNNILQKDEEDELIANFIAMNEQISYTSEIMPMEEPMDMPMQEELMSGSGKYAPIICAPPVGLHSYSSNSQSPRHQQLSSQDPSPYLGQGSNPRHRSQSGQGSSPRHQPQSGQGSSPRHRSQSSQGSSPRHQPHFSQGPSPSHSGHHPSQGSGRSPRHHPSQGPSPSGPYPSHGPSPSGPYPSQGQQSLRSNSSPRHTPTLHTTSSIYEINLEIALAESLEVVSFKSTEDEDLERAIQESRNH